MELPVDDSALRVVDAFESYTNEWPYKVSNAWIDRRRWTTYHTGAVVGHDVSDPDSPHYEGTRMEREIVHGGRQSMPVYYDNVAAPYYCETRRVFKAGSSVVIPQDWTAAGADTLTLHFHGQADNGPSPLYVAIEDSAGRVAVVVHPNANAVLSTEWRQWHIDLADLQAAGVDVAWVTSLIIGVGNRDDPKPNGVGLIYIDDIWLTKRPN
jgi:hypothetical protein